MRHERPPFLNNRASRRFVLKAIGIGITAAIAGNLKELSEAPNPPPIPELRGGHTPPERLPDDILQENELATAHITIYNTADTQLYLRKSSLDIPIFKDAKEGNHEVIIVLVDHHSVSLKAVEKLPADTRLAWEAITSTPEQEYNDFLSFRKKILKSNKAEDQIVRKTAFKGLKRMRNKEAWMKDYFENDGPWGQLVKGKDIPGYYWMSKKPETKNFLLHHPEAANKIYIFLAVGAKGAPLPKHSYPEPKWIEQYSTGDPKEGWNYRFFSPFTGFTLRHEISHYETYPFNRNSSYPHEWETDTLAYKRIKEAWEKFQSTGDSTGYPFVFVTKDGITITKSQKTSSKNNAA